MQSFISELADNAGWGALLEYLRFGEGGMQSRQKQLVRGAAKSFDEYQKRVGWMEGLQYAIDAPARITAVVETEREKRKLTG